MQYLLLFLEGIITFISPCLLPMLPIYVSYFAGGGVRSTKKTLLGAMGFVMGFTPIYVSMGTLFGTLGSFLTSYRSQVDLISGLVVIFFGLNYLGVFRLNLFPGSRSVNTPTQGFFSCVLFGLSFSISATPCVSVFLGSALSQATQQGHALTGTLMLLTYSLGLGIPFLLSAVLIDRLKSTFGWIKQNYRYVNLVCGLFLIAVGILMATGTIGWLLSLLS